MENKNKISKEVARDVACNYTTKEHIHKAINEAMRRLDECTYQEVLYAILKQLEVKNISDLLTKDIDPISFYDTVYSAVRNEQEEPFTKEEVDEINNNVKKFNNSIKWERLKLKTS